MVKHIILCTLNPASSGKKRILFLILILFSLFSYGQEQKPQATYVENEFIIWLEQGVDANSFALQSDKGIMPKRQLSKRLNIWLFEITDGNETREAKMNRIWKSPDVRLIQNNHTNIVLREVIPDDPDYSRQWAPAIIGLPMAWEEFTTGGITSTGDTIVVAVIDGGVDLDHEDLSLWKNTHEIPNNGVDDDNNGYVDDYHGWNAYNQNGSISNDGHGTHVAGIIGAIGNNGQGVCGVNWNVKVMPVGGSTTDESIAVEAYSYVLEMRARYNETSGEEGAFVVATNSSFGVDYGNPDDYPIWCSMYDEMGKVGIISCGAGPNANVNVDVVGDVPSTCPGDYLIGITNTTASDVKNSSAGYGINSIDIGAPGSAIYSTIQNNNYGNKTGTSMATPQVSGTIALMYAAMPKFMIYICKSDPAGFSLLVKESLLKGADHLPSLEGFVNDSRRLNAYGAIETLLNDVMAPSLTGVIDVTGKPVVGQTLTIEPNLGSEPLLPELGELSYQWMRDTLDIEEATFSTYILTDADIGKMISIRITAENCSGHIISSAIGPINASCADADGNCEDSFSVYPNPSSGSLTVEGQGLLIVTNILGQTILIHNIDGKTPIELPQGLYFARVGNIVKKVVIGSD